MRTFDRVPSIDSRNRNYPIRALLAPKPRRSYTWSVNTWLDQGSEGACVGFAWGHELAAKPVPVPTTNFDALAIYKRARQLDEWEGEDYDGTSVLGGAKAVMETKLLKEYRWAETEDDLALSVGYHGPAVIGVNWHRGMMDTDADGFIHPDNVVVGGHAICVFGYSVKLDAYKLHNSWGPGWGRNGDALLRRADMAGLLANQGEACVPVVRGHA